MEGDPRIDKLMIPVREAINRHVKDRDAKIDIYNRAYEALLISMEENRMIHGGNGSHWEGCEETHWDCKIAKLEAKCNNLEQENAKLKEANEDVQSRLDDYRQDYAKVVNDKCPSDEIHCGCVPILRRENRLLAEELENAKDELKNRRDALIDAQEIYNTANQHRFRYLSALELIASFVNAKDKTSVDDLIAIAGKEITVISDSVVDACSYWVQKLRDEEAENRKLKERVGSMEVALSDALHTDLKLRTRLAELEDANRWIPVTERLPVPDFKHKQYYSDCVAILSEYNDKAFACYVPIEFHADGFTYPIGWYLPNRGSPITINVTHWRPLPPPEASNE